jgi:hypothetical protein
MLTAYDFPSGLHAAAAGVDMILVGDSLGMVCLGYDNTTPVTLCDMVSLYLILFFFFAQSILDFLFVLACCILFCLISVSI